MKILENGVVQYREVPVISSFSAKVMLTRLQKLVIENDVKAVLFTLEEAKPPSFKIRKVIFENMKPAVEHVEFFCFSTGKNHLLNIAVQFYLNSAKFSDIKISVLKSYDEALNRIHEHIK